MQMDSKQLNFVSDLLNVIEAFAERHDENGIDSPYFMEIKIRQANMPFGSLIFNEAEEWVFEPEIDDE